MILHIPKQRGRGVVCGVKRAATTAVVTANTCPTCYNLYKRQAAQNTNDCIDAAALSVANLLSITHPDDRTRERETLLESFRLRVDQLMEQARREGLLARTAPGRRSQVRQMEGRQGPEDDSGDGRGD